MDSGIQDLKSDETVQDDFSNFEKLTQSYLLLKQKICRTHDLIKQYNDKVKECDRLKTDLDEMTKQAKKMTCNFNSTLAKVIRLELVNTEYKKDVEALTAKVNEHEIKMAADQQHIQQLICKIKDVEGQQNEKIMQYDLEKSSLQVKVKELEQELKGAKKSYDTMMKKVDKKMEKKISPEPTINAISTASKSTQVTKFMADAAVNTTLTNTVSVPKPQVSEKSVMTDEFYTVKGDMYPIFCAKCEVVLDPPPLQKICKIMSESCPQLIEKISSPKKTLPTLQVSTDIHSEQCKVENLTRLSETPLPHIQNPNTDFLPENLLSAHTPVEINRSGYCNNFSQMSNLMNQSGYYIGSTPVNPMTLANGNVNQAGHCSEMMAMASSFTILTSMQKKIDTLEKKLKKMLNKQKSMENKDCCQHNHPMPYYAHDINNSLQSNLTLELWKKVTELCEEKGKKDISMHREGTEKKPWKCKLKKVKLKKQKRLQKTSAGSWGVDTVHTIEHPPIISKLRERKHRHSMLLDKPNISLNNPEYLEKSVSDSDDNSYSNSFNNTFDGETDIPCSHDLETQSMFDTEAENSILKHNIRMKPLISPIKSIQRDEIESCKVLRNSIESNKSLEGETDSGILSDSIESSNRLLQNETDMETYQNVMRVKKRTEFTPPEEHLSLAESDKSLKHKISETSSIEVRTKRLDESKNPVFNSTHPSRCRKVVDLKDRKKCDSRQDLLKKLRNLKKNSKTVNVVQKDSLEHQEINVSKQETFVSEGQKRLNRTKIDSITADYIPKKKPRVAHTPKGTTSEQTELIDDNMRLSHNPVKSALNTTSKEERSCNSSSVESVTEDRLTKECIHSNEPLSNVLLTNIDESVEYNISTSQTNLKSIEAEELTPNLPSKIDSRIKTTNVEINNHEENTDVSYEDAVETSSTNDTFIKASINDNITQNGLVLNSLEKVVEENQLKTELNDQCENLEDNCLSKSANNTSMTQVVKDTTTLTHCGVQSKNNAGDYSMDPCTSNHNINCDPLTSTNTLKTSHTQNNQSKSLDIPESNSPINGLQSEINDSNIDIREKVEDACIKEEGIVNQRATNTVKTDDRTVLNRPLDQMLQYINEYKCTAKNKKNLNQNLARIRALTDKFVHRELQRLMDGNWEMSLHNEIVEKLKATCSARILAKCIVDFLGISEQYNKVLDKSYTPPAPIMTTSQQRIAALLVDLEESKPTICQLVQAGIEFKLFRLNQTVEKPMVETLARMYTVLARIQKDREKVRIFCCDALYCLGLQAIPVLYTVFTCWPEVFPNRETNKELLPKCMAHIIMAKQADDFPKLYALKNLVSVFYQYQMGTLTKDIQNELLTALQGKPQAGVDTAIILLAKSEGTTWTYKNIIRGALLPMIINNRHLNMYRAFSLLGNLMRALPVDDKDNAVGEIIDQLCDLIEAGEGPEDQQQGIISALVSLSRHNFDKVVQSVIKWTPKKPLYPRTRHQFQALLSQRDGVFWKSYLKKNKLISPQKFTRKINRKALLISA